jgi:hypothetical protein
MEMEFRTEARVGAVLIAAACLLGAQTVDVRHRHARGGGDGELSVSADGMSFTEQGKGRGHSRVWKYADIQQLELQPDSLRVLTYESRSPGWTGDREYVFDRLPAGFAQKVYLEWRDRLDQRLIAALPDAEVKPIWQLPAKLIGWRGSGGQLIVGTDRIVYREAKSGQSRTWRYADIENVASAGEFDLSIVSAERHGVWNSNSREFRFQLKQPLPEARYNDLWRRLTAFKQTAFKQKENQ